MGRSVEPLLGTRAEVEVHADPTSDASAIEDEILDEVARLEAIFTVFDPTSAIRTYRSTGTTEVPELREVLRLADRWLGETESAFNPRMQRVVELWDAAEAANCLPDQEQLAAVVAGLAEGPIDNLNAIAKAWIAEHALDAAIAGGRDVSSAWISLGGDIVHRGTEPMRVGIEDPARPYDNVAPLATAAIHNEALATSGGARRYWTIDETRYAKVLDPRTGMPVDEVASATVIAAAAADADVLATVGLVMEQTEFFALLDRVEASALVIRSDGTIHQSSDRFELRPSPSR